MDRASPDSRSPETEGDETTVADRPSTVVNMKATTIMICEAVVRTKAAPGGRPCTRMSHSLLKPQEVAATMIRVRISRASSSRRRRASRQVSRA